MDRFCIIGAGPVGLTVAKNFKQRGIPFDWFEQQDDLGGQWYYGSPHSSVYASTHLISSKRLTEYTDFPMPKGYPHYPSHQQVYDYLRSYAEHFGLTEDVQYNTSVTQVTPAGDHWRVVCNEGQRENVYRGVVVANGHHTEPFWPQYPGTFRGGTMHSRDYKTPDVLRGKRVLVVGAGNSGCDIAVEAAQHAKAAFLSLRRGYHFLPKFLFGKPLDECGELLLRWKTPRWLYRLIARTLVRVAHGPAYRHGLPTPDHRLFESHPTINSQLLYYIGHGRIAPRPDIARLSDERVHFVDGTSESIDLIIYATGFRAHFPFLAPGILDWQSGHPNLFLNAFHPNYDQLFFAGLIQPNSGLWGLADYQAQLMTAFLTALQHDRPRADWFRRLKARGHDDLSGGIHYVSSRRHWLEVEYSAYRRRLQKLLRRFGPDSDRPFTPLGPAASRALVDQH